MFGDTLAQAGVGQSSRLSSSLSSDRRKRLLAVSGKVSQGADHHGRVSCVEENSLDLPIVLLIRRTIKVLI